MIKILYIITQGEMGGAQRYVFDLATNLDKTRYEILAAVGTENPDLNNSLLKKGIKTAGLHHLKRSISPGHDLLAIFEIKKLIKKYQPDIVHLNSSKAGVLGSIAAYLAGNRNVVFTAHGFAFLEPNNFLVKQIYFWAEKFASLFRKKIITVSDFDRTSAIADKLSGPEKLITVHNGIILSSPPHEGGPEGVAEQKNTMTSPNPSSRGGVKPVIGTIAHDYPTKDLKTLRAAFEIVKEEFPQAELKIVSGVTDAVKLLSGFDVYVCSSVKEGFPYTILEAMRAGLPIVSTNVGGIPEAITPYLSPSPLAGEGGGEGAVGILVPPKNPEALAQAIKQLLVNPELALKLGQNAQKKVQQFSLDKMLAETERVYQSL